MSLSSLNPKNSNSDYDAAKLFVETEENAVSVIELAQRAAEEESKKHPNVVSSPIDDTSSINFGSTSKQGW
jgi:hypothetical protein